MTAKRNNPGPSPVSKRKTKRTEPKPPTPMTIAGQLGDEIIETLYRTTPVSSPYNAQTGWTLAGLVDWLLGVDDKGRVDLALQTLRANALVLTRNTKDGQVFFLSQAGREKLRKRPNRP